MGFFGEVMTASSSEVALVEAMLHLHFKRHHSVEPATSIAMINDHALLLYNDRKHLCVLEVYLGFSIFVLCLLLQGV